MVMLSRVKRNSGCRPEANITQGAGIKSTGSKDDTQKNATQGEVRQGIAILGGTFDPIHVGHLRSAVEVYDHLQVEQVTLIPAFQPVLRHAPGASAEQRLHMLSLAVSERSLLQIDDREIQRGGPSFMVDTLTSLRQEVGAQVPLYLVLGADAFVRLDEWHRWRELLSLAHLVVLQRPGQLAQPAPEVMDALATCRASAAALKTQPAGGVCELQLTQLAVSATMIRQLCAEGGHIDYLVPTAVQKYIEQQGLYQAPSAPAQERS